MVRLLLGYLQLDIAHFSLNFLNRLCEREVEFEQRIGPEFCEPELDARRVEISVEAGALDRRHGQDDGCGNEYDQDNQRGGNSSRDVFPVSHFGTNPTMQRPENNNEDCGKKHRDKEPDHDFIKQSADHNDDGEQYCKRDITRH